ncbi:MAG: L,D-transpeptidase family protein [Patescibacteria group bacterium]
MQEEKQKFQISKTLFGTLIFIIVALSALVSLLILDKTNLAKTSDRKFKQFYDRIVDSGIGFINIDKFFLPINDKKFEDEVEGYIKRKESFIEIDLTAMEVTLYKEGKLFKKLPVLSKGKEGSWWETPTGNYKILTKESNHFSSIGSVWMPWSMQFYGNFFIHGWPYYEDGTEVSSTYSGGCVRLSTLDAKEVYDFAKEDMALLLRDKEDSSEFAKIEQNDLGLPVPQISANSFIISNLASGEVLLEKNASSVLPISSVSNIMAGVVASELVYLGRPITVSENMLSNSLSAFEPTLGERYIAFDLLYPLMMQSSDEAASLLARFIGENHFISNMNKKATSLSMKDTVFTDVSGELPSNISSAKDLEKLLRYTYFKRKFILDISKGHQDYRFEGRKLDNLENLNPILYEANLVGLKSGKTDTGGEAIAGVWEFEKNQVEENGAQNKALVSIVILGSKDGSLDTEALLAWIEKNFDL